MFSCGKVQSRRYLMCCLHWVKVLVLKYSWIGPVCLSVWAVEGLLGMMAVLLDHSLLMSYFNVTSFNNGHGKI